nr:EOG090X0IGM [Eurycercus lamellatus]
MVGRLLKSMSDALLQFEAVYLSTIWRRPPPPEWIPIVVQSSAIEQTRQSSPFDINNIFDGFLWGVPVCRRSAEKRMMRKYGANNWTNGRKLILPHLKVCGSCGHYHEDGRLCPHCYAKVKAETSNMQEQMIKELGIKPVDKEVVILYEGEKQQHNDEFFQGKRIVEMNKPRPHWFSKNLLQKTGPVTEQGNSEASAIKPHDLG